MDTLHITGADRTYDAIVYGTGPEGAERRRRDDPVLHKPFSAELGNLTPIIVVPGRWCLGRPGLPRREHRDDAHQQRGLQLHDLAGHRHRRRLAAARGAAGPDPAAPRAAPPTRLAYYPGAAARFGAFGEVHPEAELFGDPSDGHLPWMLIPGLSPDAAGDPCYRVEAFCSVTAETPIDAPDAVTFLERATRVRQRAPVGHAQRDAHRGSADGEGPGDPAGLERAIGDLRYGTVSLNHWSAAGYGIGITPWGAFPGNPRHDIGSGTGFVHNPLMFDAAEKTVDPRPVPRVAQAALVLEPPRGPQADAGAHPVRG